MRSGGTRQVASPLSLSIPFTWVTDYSEDMGNTLASNRFPALEPRALLANTVDDLAAPRRSRLSPTVLKSLNSQHCFCVGRQALAFSLFPIRVAWAKCYSEGSRRNPPMARVPTLLILSLLSAGSAFAQTAPTTVTSIRTVLNRVHGYLLTAAPLRPVDATTGAAVSLDNMPKNVALGPTTLHIDSYEWGVTYAGMFQATDIITGDFRFRAYARTNINGLARMAAHMRANYPDATADNFPAALRGTYSLRPVLFPRIPDEAGAQCSAMIKASRAPGMENLRPLIDIYANWMSTQ